MKTVLISIQPKWCELIANGKKTVEVRKTRPKIETPFKVYIYCTANKHGTKDLLEIHGTDGNIRKANGKVIGEFVCDVIYELHDWHLDPRGVYQEIEEENLKKLLKMSQLTYDELCLYRNGMPYYKPVFVWRISNLVIYNKPRELSEFYIFNNAAIQSCKHRKIVGQPEYKTAHNGWIKGSYICNKGEPDWCIKCKTKPLTRPPQSWCYVEGVIE